MVIDIKNIKPANLDEYTSVTFSDPPYGQMIMSSEVVKWLCINRAKDYFEEMEKVNHD